MVLSREDIEEKLGAIGITDPSEDQLNLAEEEFLHGFRHAVDQVEDEGEKERLEELLEEQQEAFE